MVTGLKWVRRLLCEGDERLLAENPGVDCTLAGPDPFGEIVTAHLDVKGNAIPGDLPKLVLILLRLHHCYV
jgi:hypothetical protein